jgi:flagellar basal-body rod modification protein FlgD
MSTTAVGATSRPATQAGAATPAAPSSELDENAFLRLLTAQLQNQDPLSPVDNQAFVAQLAQFSSVEQLHAVSSRLDTLLLATASQNQMATASLVGKDVSYRASAVQLDGSTAPAVQVKLAAQGGVTAVITDASGHTVRTLAAGSHAAGTFDLGWDGRDDAGRLLPTGSYGVKLSARGADGSSVSVEARARGRVGGVTFDGDAAQLLVGGNPVKLSDVVEITQG